MEWMKEFRFSKEADIYQVNVTFIPSLYPPTPPDTNSLFQA